MLYDGDNNKDCDDVSDEKNCRTIYIDPEKYLKSKPPPSTQPNTKLPIILRYFFTIFIVFSSTNDPSQL